MNNPAFDTAAPPLTAQQRAILRLLYEFRQLDTPTIHQAIAPHVTERALRRTLMRLETRRFIICHRQPATVTIYGLTLGGAQAIGQKLLHQHYRMPSREAFVYRTLEARIATQAERRGFVVYRGTPASPLSAVRALQNETRQVVVKHWRAREKAAIAVADAAGEFVAQRQTQLNANINPIPLVFREWYIHRPTVTGRILLVARKESSQDYWKARIADLCEVGKLLRVVCIFGQPPPADLRAALERVSFQVMEIAQFGPFLDAMGGREAV